MAIYCSSRHFTSTFSSYRIVVNNKPTQDRQVINRNIYRKHSKDRDTSDGAYTPDQYERIYQAILDHRSGPLKGLGAGILEALRIKEDEINLGVIDTLIDSDQPDERGLTDLLGKSPVIEPDARKRRKR